MKSEETICISYRGFGNPNNPLHSSLLILYTLTLLPPHITAQPLCCPETTQLCGDQCCDGSPLSDQCGQLKIIQLPPVAGGGQPTPALPTNSRFYTWKDPNTGTLYLSNQFPPWYRNPHYPQLETYPPVQVFDEYNRLIDDTGHLLPPEQAAKLRSQAQSHHQQQLTQQAQREQQHNDSLKQQRLEFLIQTWQREGILPQELLTLLEDKVKIQQVTLAMTTQQVQQILGPPKSVQETKVDKKSHKTLTYDNKIILLIEDRVHSLTEKGTPANAPNNSLPSPSSLTAKQ